MLHALLKLCCTHSYNSVAYTPKIVLQSSKCGQYSKNHLRLFTQLLIIFQNIDWIDKISKIYRWNFSQNLKILSKLKILTRFWNINQILEYWQNFWILTKCQDMDWIQNIDQNIKIFTTFLNIDTMSEYWIISKILRKT